MLHLTLIAEKWNETLHHTIPKHKKQPLKDIISTRTITKPRDVIQNVINKEQTGLDIANLNIISINRVIICVSSVR